MEFFAKPLQQKHFALIIFNNKGFNYGTPNRIRHNKNNSASTAYSTTGGGRIYGGGQSNIGRY